MALVRRRQASLNTGLSRESIKAKLCPLSALFLIYFDNKTGYAISWKRSLPGLEVEGVVEYKSLPSGVHSVKHDLIYFTHGNYAGLSAFINAPVAEESRNARMIAVGVLVPLSGGKLGKCWEHAEELKRMADNLIADTSMTKVLEDYWEKYKAPSLPPETSKLQSTSLSSIEFKSLSNTSVQPSCNSRTRSLSDSQILLNSYSMCSHHPGWSMGKLLDTFGPLIFPIYRAALLRQRILITTHAPVQETCNFIYNISVLSSIPLAKSQFLEQNLSFQPLRPLFSIGVHDIAFLEEESARAKTNSNISGFNPLEDSSTSRRGWIACTTDSILAMKSMLYDVLIEMPSSSSKNNSEKSWPKVESPPGVELRATQRDFRRYKSLKSSLSLFKSSNQDLTKNSSDTSFETNYSHRLLCKSSISDEKVLCDLPPMNNIIEPTSWSAFAYSSLIWWISGEEQRSDFYEESESDSVLLSGLSLPPSKIMSSKLPSHPAVIIGDSKAKYDVLTWLEIAVTTYFHRMTTKILTTLENATTTSELDEDQFDENNPLQGDPENFEYESRAPIYVSSTDVMKMGLDIWSDRDHRFIQNLTREYVGRRSFVESLRLEMCGIKIC